MDSDVIAVGILDAEKSADRGIHRREGYGDLGGLSLLQECVKIIHLEGDTGAALARRRPGVGDRDRGACHIVLDPPHARHVWDFVSHVDFQRQEAFIEGSRPRHIRDGVGKESDVLDHGLGLGGFDRGHDLLSGVEDVVARDEGESALGEGLLTSFDVVAFEAHDERDGEGGLAGGFDDAVGDDVTIHDAAEDVDQDALDVRVTEDDAEGGRDLILRRSTAYVEEVGRAATGVLDNVHGRHGETGTVHQTGDVAIEADVVQRELGGGDFTRIFLGLVTHRDDGGLTVESVVVEVELRVEGEEFALVGDDERVDLDHGTVAVDEQLVEIGEQLRSLVHQWAGEAESRGDLAALERHEAEGRIDMHREDLLRGVLGDFFDVHAAFGAGDDDRSGGGAVEEDGEVEFALDVDGFTDEHLADFLALGAGLVGHEDLTEHVGGEFLGFSGSVTEVNAAFETVLKGTLTAAARMDLGFDHDFSAEF